MYHQSLEKSLLQIIGELAPDQRPVHWASAVLKLSNHYVTKPDESSPWKEHWAQLALLSYYHPLNQARAFGVATRGAARGFFKGLNHLTDLGCGSGAATLGLMTCHRFSSVELVDQSGLVLDYAKRLVTHFASQVADDNPAQVHLEAHQSTLQKMKLRGGPGSLLCLSYTLTESIRDAELKRLLLNTASDLPVEAVVLIEPSTSQDGRKLQALRSRLIEWGYEIKAPCTHEKDCPLLKFSEKDWCHDRFTPDLPSWWPELERHLPIKNETVTVSYLLARRPSENQTGASPNLVGERPEAQPDLQPDLHTEARVIGDPLFEKHKVRQLICRNDEREFLSWLPKRLKESKALCLERGDIIQMSEELFKDRKGAPGAWELRLGPDEIRALAKPLES